MMGSDRLVFLEATEDDYAGIVHLFNKNQVYQFSDGVPITVKDLELTMKIKEVSRIFVVKDAEEILGTSAFFKFSTHECLDTCSSFSGFLLIDANSRTGSVANVLYRSMIEEVSGLGLSELYAEISKYNKPSLSLSRLNGFSEFKDTYEDTLHYRLLRSNLPKVLKMFQLSRSYAGGEYDLSTFKIEGNYEDDDRRESTICAVLSGDEMEFRMQEQSSLPFYVGMDILEAGIFKEESQYVFRVRFKSDRVKKVYCIIGGQVKACLTRKRPHVPLRVRKGKISVQARVVTVGDDISLQLERAEDMQINKNMSLKRRFQGYKLVISPRGGLHFSRRGVVFLEDSFLLFSYPRDAMFKVVEREDYISISFLYKGAKIQKVIRFLDDKTISCAYYFNEKSKKLLPDLIKQVFKINSQEHFIWDGQDYLLNIPGKFPVEHEDFIRKIGFKNEIFQYYIPSEKKKISYSPIGKATNQMQFRPLSYIKKEELRNMVYQITIEDVATSEIGIDTNSKKDTVLSNFKLVNRDTLSNIQNIRLEQEHGLGPRRRLSNRKRLSEDRVILNYSKNTLSVKDISPVLDFFSISFEFKMDGKVENVSKHIFYNNKSYIFENTEELLLFSTLRTRYFRFFAKNGVFYSYRENNKIMIRCGFCAESTAVANIHISEYERD